MKLVNYISALCIVPFFLSACDSDLDKVTYNESETQPAVLATVAEAYVLNEQEPDGVAVNFTWIKPAINYSGVMTNSLEMDVKGKGFANRVVLASSKTAYAYATTTAELNRKINTLLSMYEMSVAPVELEIRIATSISNAAQSIYSNIVSTTITPYSEEKEYPRIWVMGNYSGWNWSEAQCLFSFAENTTYEGILDFGKKATDGFKISGVTGNWDNAFNWGLDANVAAPEAEATSIQLITDGGSKEIKCYSKRFYRLKFDTKTLLLTKDISFDYLSIIGDAVNGDTNWGTDIEMNFDAKKQIFWVDAELTTGNMKFRTDKGWDNVNFGSKTEGLLDGGDNIKVEAGRYRVYVNLNNPAKMTYELSTKDYGK